MKYLALIRIPNLVMIIVAQCIIRYGFFNHLNVEISLNTKSFVLLVLATALIAAGGYIINDIYDIVADKINKPNKCIVQASINIKKAKFLYYLCTFTGVGLGFFISTQIQKPLYTLYFCSIAMGLYVYSRFLKTIPLLGNILISVIVALSILIVGVFELLPSSNSYNINSQMIVFSTLKDIAIFAFMINFLREIVKDIEDIQGDYVARYRTIPIILGIKRTAQITAVMGLINVMIISMYTFTYLYNEKWTVAIVLFGIIAPLGYVCAQLWEATSKKQFKRLSLFLKIIMFNGICAIPLISYSLDHVI